MVHFDINGKILVETIMAQEADNRFRIHVILMFCRFHRFRLYQESTFEPVLAGIITCHRQHHGKMFLFAFHVGVQQAHISFTSAPEHIVFATQGNTSVNRVFDLRAGTSHSREIRICSRPVHITFMPEHIGGRPQQLLPCRFLMLFGIFNHRMQVFFKFGQRRCFIYDIHIVETIVRYVTFRHKFESGIHLILGTGNTVCARIPRKCLRSATELVGSLRT